MPLAGTRERATITSLQACRAVAALIVVLRHTSIGIFAFPSGLPKYFESRPFGHLFDFGLAGVDFFFVLSGFIMMHANRDALGNPRQLPSYLWKRFTRIYLPYWLVLLFILPVYFIVPRFGNGHEREPWTIVTSVFLLPHADPYFVLGVAWTLVYEVFFYLLFALLIVERRLGLVVLSVWIGLILTQFHVATFPWSFLANYINLRFVAGIGAALVVERFRLPVPRLLAVLGTVLFVGTGTLDTYAGPLPYYQQAIGYTLGSVLTIAGLVQAERAGTIFMPRWLSFLGDASYAIYLVHFPALSVLAKLARTMRLDAILPGAALFLLLALGAVAVSCSFYQWVERPVLGWVKRRRNVSLSEAPGRRRWYFWPAAAPITRA